MKSNRNIIGSLTANSTTIVFIAMLFVFIGSSAFFALKLKEGIIPDEPHHFLVPRFFSATWGIPADGPDTIPYGTINHWPFLSYWINARILNLLDWAAPELGNRAVLIVFRLLGVIYSTITVIYSYLFAKEMIGNRWGQLFVVFLLTNTLMFTFLSGGNSYDNLMNLCSFAGIYYLTCVFKGKPFYKNSFMWLTSIMVGSLVKVTMLPLAAVTGSLWFLYTIKERKTIDFRTTWNPKAIGATLILTALFAINFSIYGINIIKYRTLLPSCIQFFTAKQCMAYPQFARDRDLELQKKLSLSDVVSEGYPDPVEYSLDYWIASMLKRIYGIMGHKAYFPDVSITVHRLLILLTVFITIRYWEKPSFATVGSYVIFISYVFILFLDNYNTELYFGFKNAGIQGRYVFPVIGVYYTMMVYFLLKIRSPIFRWMTFTAVFLLFLYGSPIVFLLRFYSSTVSSWFI